MSEGWLSAGYLWDVQILCGGCLKGKSGLVKSGQVKSGQVNSDQLELVQVRSGQVKRMLITLITDPEMSDVELMSKYIPLYYRFVSFTL